MRRLISYKRLRFLYTSSFLSFCFCLSLSCLLNWIERKERVRGQMSPESIPSYFSSSIVFHSVSSRKAFLPRTLMKDSLSITHGYHAAKLSVNEWPQLEQIRLQSKRILLKYSTLDNSKTKLKTKEKLDAKTNFNPACRSISSVCCVDLSFSDKWLSFYSVFFSLECQSILLWLQMHPTNVIDIQYSC